MWDLSERGVKESKQINGKLLSLHTLLLRAHHSGPRLFKCRDMLVREGRRRSLEGSLEELEGTE